MIDVSDEAIGVLNAELHTSVEPNEFNEAYIAIIDGGTAIALCTRRGQRTCGYRFYSLDHVDLDTALKAIRGYYRRREVN